MVSFMTESTRLSPWRRNSPFVQNLLVAACLFCYPGLYLAVVNLGAGGGKVSSTFMADVSNGVLYGVFTFSALVGGSTVNVLGPRVATLTACAAYPLYIGSLWYFDETAHLWFPIFAGALLGFGAGHLWTVAGFMSNCYAEEHEKAKFRAIQWVGNASGATLGAIIAFAINIHADRESVPDAVYITFIVLQAAATTFALLMVPVETLVRRDGTQVTTIKATTFKDSLKAFRVVLTDWRVLIMIPAFYAGEVSLPLQSSMNAYAYNLRTRSLNGILNALAQIPFVIALAYVLDGEQFGSRRRRGLIGIVATAIIILGTYVAQITWLSSWKFDRSIPGPDIDWTDSSYGGAAAIYTLYGAQYGLLENLTLWFLGTLSNEKEKQACMSGLFVAFQSAGVGTAFGIDASDVPYLSQSAAYFSLAALTFIVLGAVCSKTNDTNYEIEGEVQVPEHAKIHLDVKAIEE